MKYDAQIAELKNLLPSAKNILIAVPTGADIDKLSAGLGLFLTFEAAGKDANIVTDDAMLVSQSHLFGVDHVQKTLPPTDGGNLTLTLEGVAATDGTVPALEKLDWFAEGNNLNLVFHVLPGQTFQPAKIVPKYQGSGFNLIFTIGAVNLNSLGNIYSQNPNVFSGTHIVNIDTQTANSSFGQTNVVDSQATSVSEIMVNLLSDLGYAIDQDVASNLLAGIFDSTNNLLDAKATADTYMAVANCLRVGGRKPSASIQNQPSIVTNSQPVVPQTSGLDLSALIPKTAPAPVTSNQGIPDYMVPPVVSSTEPVQSFNNSQDDSESSPEERPMEEGVISETVEPEWLTPKIFKGTSLG